MRLGLMQAWPVLRNFTRAAPLAAWTGSASGKTSIGAWPPNSIETRFIVAAALAAGFFPKVDGLLQIAAVLAAFSMLGALVQAPAFTYIAELFPANVRCTGASFGQNIGTVFGNGIAPFAALTLRSIHYVAGGMSENEDRSIEPAPGPT
ncbi:hypothetical protein ABGB12_32380 [Actinocorallia sp. B10E7]|uniref:hypothetical protein n=1 Tax=Actinocorallia sp. B10E7 TaxID=3153558 RepID=UPI00325DAA9C